MLPTVLASYESDRYGELRVVQDHRGTLSFVRRGQDGLELTVYFDTVVVYARSLEFSRAGHTTAVLENKCEGWGEVGEWLRAHANETADRAEVAE